jgi:threonyl-tRNA synthetase
VNRNLLERNRKRELFTTDHRLIGQQLDLYSINEEVGSGLILWHPKGTTVRNIIRDFWEKEHIKSGYKLVSTPHIAREELWQVSGHLDYYKQNMYLLEKDDEKYVVKPMNCPLHLQIYKSRPRSYRELPIRYAEWGTVYRCERSGTLQGLLRARGFTQDDAHIFCSPRQANKEILNILDLTERMLQEFGFHELHASLSTEDPQRPKEYMGTNLEWRQAKRALAEALEKKKIAYKKNPEKPFSTEQKSTSAPLMPKTRNGNAQPSNSTLTFQNVSTSPT